MLITSRRLRRITAATCVAGAALFSATAHASAEPLQLTGSLTVDRGVATYELTNSASSQGRVTMVDLRSPETIREVASSRGECKAEGNQAFCRVNLAPGEQMTIHGYSDGYEAGRVHDLCAFSPDPEAASCLKLTATAPPPPSPPAAPPAPPVTVPAETTPSNGTAVTDTPGTDCHCLDIFARITRTDPFGSDVNTHRRGVVGMYVDWMMRCSGGARFRTCKGKLQFSLPGHPDAEITIAPMRQKKVRKPIYRTKNGIRQKGRDGRFIIDGWREVREWVKGRSAKTQRIHCVAECGGFVTGKSYVRVVIPRAAGLRKLDVKVARDCPGTPLADQDLKLAFNSWGTLQKGRSVLS